MRIHLTLLVVCALQMAALSFGQGTPPSVVKNQFLTLAVDPGSGVWTVATTYGGHQLDSAASAVNTSLGLFRSTDQRFDRTASAEPFRDALGSGQQVKMVLTDKQAVIGWELDLKVYEEFGGLCLDWKMQNTSQQEFVLRTVSLAEGLGAKPHDSKGPHVLSNGFNSWATSHVVPVIANAAVMSSDVVAVDDPPLVAGFLSAERAFGSFGYGLPDGQNPFLQASAEFNVVVGAGEVRAADSLLILFPSDATHGLESYAAAVQKVNNLTPLKRTSTAWCSWYAGYGRARQANLSDLEQAMLKNAEIVKTLKPWGIDTLRAVDDSSEELYGDWNFPYVPHGMGKLAASLKGLGTKPGVWVAPAFVSETSEVFKKHPDWMQMDAEGHPVTNRDFYGNTMHFLDTTNPEALAHLKSIFQRVHDWGYQYVMIDFLQWLALGDRYQNAHLTRAEVYRQALRTIRETLGPDIYLLGCGAPQLASVGLVDGMRIGPDQWGESGFENIAARSYEQGVWWVNDPDALVGSDATTEEYRAWVTLAGLSSGAITLGDDLTSLSPERLAILKRIHPVAGISGRPADLFGTIPAQEWVLPIQGMGTRMRVVGLFNWGGKEALTHHLEPLDYVPTSKAVLVYDFWNEILLTIFNGKLDVAIPPRESRTLVITGVTGAPQIVAVSNHLSQVTLKDPSWSATDLTLKGQTQGAPGDSYHIVAYCPPEFDPDQAVVNNKGAFLVKQQDGIWWIPVTGSGAWQQWSVRFRPHARAKPNITTHTPVRTDAAG